MSKTLILVRHAKSSWEDASLRDDERPLLEIGIKRTKRVINYCVKNAVIPDLIVSSHAVRAFETARLFAKGLDYPYNQILIERNIYYQGADGLYDLVLALPDNKNQVMLVGHNPAMTQFANMFLDDKLHYLPTTGMVCVDFDTDQWQQLPFAARQIHFYISPKMLK